MSLAPKNKWQPSASINALRQRANIIQRIRHFFQTHGVLEVETPLLCHTSVTDPFIESIPALVKVPGSANTQLYQLQTSPEYAMKRLLAAGSGSIFQITKAFRQEEVSARHNPEFTMLEWYRLDYDHHALMNDMDDLLQYVLSTEKAERLSYHDLFMQHFGFNPHTVSLQELARVAGEHHILVQDTVSDNDTWLMLLMSHVLEPLIAKTRPLFIYDFPLSQSALARIGNNVASRFEVYFKGVELANGFHELQDEKEQSMRFKANLVRRKELGLAEMLIDENFLAALTHGLPDCAGVALGVDRLVMLAHDHACLSEVLSFEFARV